eukprot:1815616-Pleurochrysis_carterae.AAC.2
MSTMRTNCVAKEHETRIIAASVSSESLGKVARRTEFRATYLHDRQRRRATGKTGLSAGSDWREDT